MPSPLVVAEAGPCPPLYVLSDLPDGLVVLPVYAGLEPVGAHLTGQAILLDREGQRFVGPGLVALGAEALGPDALWLPAASFANALTESAERVSSPLAQGPEIAPRPRRAWSSLRGWWARIVRAV